LKSRICNWQTAVFNAMEGFKYDGAASLKIWQCRRDDFDAKHRPGGVMAAAEPAVSCIRFSTRDRPKRERVPFWCEFFGRHIIRTRIELASEAGFDAQATFWAVRGLRIHWCAYSAGARVLRTRELISANDDNIALLIDRRGTAMFSQAGHEVALERAGGVAALQTEPASMAFPRVRYMAVVAPIKALHPFTRSIEDRAGHHIPSDTEALRLLSGYVDSLKREPFLSDPKLIALAVSHVHDLMALALGATRDGAALALGRGVRAARIKAIQIHICENLAKHDLSVQGVAAQYGLSPRYIHMLFEREGTTFSTFVREQRLLEARAMLRSPRYEWHSISSIAFAAGFDDLSHFNRSFRRRFGATPTEVRLAR
jgi:AraC-like DNA-binding protein